MIIGRLSHDLSMVVNLAASVGLDMVEDVGVKLLKIGKVIRNVEREESLVYTRIDFVSELSLNHIILKILSKLQWIYDQLGKHDGLPLEVALLTHLLAYYVRSMLLVSQKLSIHVGILESEQNVGILEISAIFHA